MRRRAVRTSQRCLPVLLAPGRPRRLLTAESEDTCSRRCRTGMPSDWPQTVVRDRTSTAPGLVHLTDVARSATDHSVPGVVSRRHSKVAFYSTPSRPAGSVHDGCNWHADETLSRKRRRAGRELAIPDWQPIPINAYPRPKGATPVHASLVPAYEPCASPNRQHGPPLAFASCNPPAQTSDELTVGSRGLQRQADTLGICEHAEDAPGRPAESPGRGRRAARGDHHRRLQPGIADGLRRRAEGGDLVADHGQAQHAPPRWSRSRAR